MNTNRHSLLLCPFWQNILAPSATVLVPNLVVLTETLCNQLLFRELFSGEYQKNWIKAES